MTRSSLSTRHTVRRKEPVLESHSNPTILVVDDDHNTRGHLVALLGKTYQVVEADHGSIGIRQAKDIVPDLIVSAIMMPYLDGFEMCKVIKQDPVIKHIPVILLCEQDSPDDLLLALEAGADSSLARPFADEVLSAQVRNVIENRKNIRSHYSRKEFMEPAHLSIPTPEKRFMDQVKTIVEEEMGNSGFNLGAFAERMHRCERQLQRNFKAILGVTPMEYVRVMRLKRATQLIDQRAGNISEIAFQVGFKNPRHFTSTFRKFFDVSPKEYMKTTLKAEKATWRRRARVH